MEQRSIYICNLNDAWHSMLLRISNELECSIFLLISSPVQADKFEYNQMIVKFESGEIRRTIHTYFDEGWKFIESGLPLPGEDKFVKKNVLKRLRMDRSSIWNIAKFNMGSSDFNIRFGRCTEWNRITESR